jgi:putative PIN family toxin of toxin-antitoxin system
MIVVFDTNVWVSAMHFERRKSPPILALELARNRYTIATCNAIEAEISRILAAKFGWQPGEVHYRLNFFLAESIHIEIKGDLRVCRDPNDDMILECAVLAGAQFIISGDKDLLALESYRGIRIVTPAEFLAENA